MCHRRISLSPDHSSINTKRQRIIIPEGFLIACISFSEVLIPDFWGDMFILITNCIKKQSCFVMKQLCFIGEVLILPANLKSFGQAACFGLHLNKVQSVFPFGYIQPV